jgi:hypothetical protein
LSLKSPPLGHIDVNLPGIDIHAIHAPSGKRSLSLNGLSSTLTIEMVVQAHAEDVVAVRTGLFRPPSGLISKC